MSISNSRHLCLPSHVNLPSRHRDINTFNLRSHALRVSRWLQSKIYYFLYLVQRFANEFLRWLVVKSPVAQGDALSYR